ncbi:MAG: PEGA domain-containing protein [Woeseiaceae bacterium]|nr:PEGA domain-containing protein [Woeseiaceae bacterium]
MSFDHLILRDVEGQRRLDADALPLRIGTGSDSGLRLPGPGGGPIVLLDILDGEPFVQPVGRDESVVLNGEPLSASARLRDGDELAFFGSRLLVSVGDVFSVEVRLEDSAYVTQPPELTAPGEAPADEDIAPTAFSRAAETRAIAAADKKSPLKAIIIGGLAVLTLASFLLFTSKSVQFDIAPGDPDSVSVEGAWFQLPLGDRVLLRQGEYTLVVEKSGYFDVRQTFVVGEEQAITVSVEMRRLPGQLTVVTEPATDATVSIDEMHIGPAPLGPVELQPGEHSISVESERFLPFSDIVDFAGLGRNDVMTVQLVPRWSEVSVQSQPSGAVIYAGEEQVGVTPAVIDLFEGTHQLTVVAEGYKAWDGSISVEPNVPQELPAIVLEEADARLLVNSIPRGANVLVNGRYRGQAPLTLDLEPDVSYEIGLSRAGYGSTSRTVRLQSAASETITVDLTARTGTVTVNVSPPDAIVTVGGRSQGPGSTTLRLSSAPQRITVSKPGYETWTRTVTPRPGYPQTLNASLRSEEAIARSRIATEVESVDGVILKRVEPGTFVMGSSRGEQGRRANEVLVPVTLTRPFYISTNLVTNREFLDFDPQHDSGADEHVSLAADTNPVANVTWQQAAEYCNWLSSREGLTPVYEERFGEYEAIKPFPNGYRLPTEAEWAWALRFGGAPAAQKFSWGDQWPPRGEAGNYADRASADVLSTIMINYDDGFASTSPVGSFPANRLGLYDAGGNVAEWVNDFYTVPTPGLTEPVVDPLGPERPSTGYVIRGSSWKHAGIAETRLAYRDYGEEARTDLGFRVVRNAD